MLRSVSFLLLVILFGIGLTACSGVRPLKEGTPKYSEEFSQTVRAIKSLIAKGKYASARAELNKLDNSQLSSVELAEKFNLIGLIYFRQKKYPQALSMFTQAENQPFDSLVLKSQISLNIASCDYKLRRYQKSLNRLQDINPQNLKESDLKNIYLLRHILAEKLNLPYEKVQSLFEYLSITGKVDGENVEKNPYFRKLSRLFSLLESDQQWGFVEKNNSRPGFILPYLGKFWSDYLQRDDDPVSAQRVNNWFLERYPKVYPKLSNEVSIDLDAPIETKRIGVVLPLTGSKKSFGNRVLVGLTFANNALETGFELVVRDSQNSAGLARDQVRELIETQNVSMIIGGLYGDSATVEYQTAKSLGAGFISLSPVYLSREMKNSQLIEISGSVQSLVNSALSDTFVRKRGKRVAIFYSDDRRGKVFLDEFWKQAEAKGVEITSVASYSKGQTDFRDSVGKLVGLGYTRERQQEYDLMADIYETKHGSLKRVQVLKPIVEFDWVFVTGYPQELLQIAPAFNYHGVKKFTFVGGPSWRSRTLLRNKDTLGNVIYFSGMEASSKDFFSNEFKKSYGKTPKLLEALGYEALNITNDLLRKANLRTRGQLLSLLSEKSKLSGKFSDFRKMDEAWIKNFTPNLLASIATENQE